MRTAIHRLVGVLGASLLVQAGPAVVSVAADDVVGRVYVSAFDEQTGAMVTDLRDCGDHRPRG